MIPSGVGPPHFVLDHNFPIVALSVAWPLMVRLSRLAEIEPELIRGHDDWEILYALNQRGLAERRSVPPNQLIARERDAIREHLIQRPLLQSEQLPSDDLLAEWRDLPEC